MNSQQAIFAIQQTVMGRSAIFLGEVTLRILLLSAGMVVLAFLIGRFVPQKRRRIKRVLVPFAIWLLMLALGWGLKAVGWDAGVAVVTYAALLLGYVTIINLLFIAIFDLIFPLVRLEIPEIVSELGLGFAYIVAAIAVLRISGVNLSGIIATSAVVTGVIGLSLQATLGNILGGVALQMDDSIHVGDWVQLENGKQGRVTEIRWRHAVVETRDWDTMIIPNASLLAQNIIILGKRQGQPVKHRMWVYFNVDFRFSPAEVIEVVDKALQEAPIENAATDPAPHCICFDFAKDNRDSFAYYAVRYWLTNLAKDDPTSSLIRLRVHAALRRAGIPLAVPAAALFISQDDPDHDRRKISRGLDMRVAALDNVTLFDHMTPEEKARIAPRIRHVPFTKGEVITKQGATAHWLYVLTKGEVEVRLRSESGEERAINTIKAPAFFGEMGVMTGAKRSTTIVALTEVDCFRIEKDDFHQIITERPEIADGISSILAQRQVELAAERENLDSTERNRRLDAEQSRILAGIKAFFGLED